MASTAGRFGSGVLTTTAAAAAAARRMVPTSRPLSSRTFYDVKKSLVVHPRPSPSSWMRREPAMYTRNVGFAYQRPSQPTTSPYPTSTRTVPILRPRQHLLLRHIVKAPRMTMHWECSGPPFTCAALFTWQVRRQQPPTPVTASAHHRVGRVCYAAHRDLP